MSCQICHRSSCTRSFHSLEAQERFDKKQEMSDDIDELREDILRLQDVIKDMDAESQNKVWERDLKD